MRRRRRAVCSLFGLCLGERVHPPVFREELFGADVFYESRVNLLIHLPRSLCQGSNHTTQIEVLV